jgi:hypothetical protein
MRSWTRILPFAVLCTLSPAACRQPERPVAGAQVPRPDGGYLNCEPKDGTQVCDPSLYELIARPDWYDGKIVSVAGVLDPGREAFLLFAAEDAYRMYVPRSAVLLALGRDLYGKDYSSVAGGWAIVTGKYSAHGRGSAGRFGGVITEIQNIFPYKSSRVPVVQPRK